LFEEKAALASTTEAELADELFIAGFAAGRTGDPGKQVPVASAGQISISARVRGTGHGLGRAYAGRKKGAYRGRFTPKEPKSNKYSSAGSG
jgi:hypothetical protein